MVQHIPMGDQSLYKQLAALLEMSSPDQAPVCVFVVMFVFVEHAIVNLDRHHVW